MSQKYRRATAMRIVNGVRQLYLANYNWGRALTQYAREQAILTQLDGPISDLRSQGDSLKRTFVEADNYAHYKTYHGPSLIRKNDPLKKIPTAPW
jgi:hypothetical protein